LVDVVRAEVIVDEVLGPIAVPRDRPFVGRHEPQRDCATKEPDLDAPDPYFRYRP
jgi:hypothetical protein